MKDTIITIKRKKTELYTLVAAVIVAYGLNIYSIAAYDTPWRELYTEIPWVLLWGIGIYILWTILRICFCGIVSLFKRK